MLELRSGSWTDRCPRTVSGYPSRTSRENVGKNRNGRARGVNVRKGKLLAGDSGRKIAEVIDLRGAIYQRGSREDGGGARRGRCVRAHPCTCTDPCVVCVRISGKGKRGRVFVRFAKCTTGERDAKEGDEELGGREVG